MAYADKERLTSLAQGIRDRLLIKDKTEAQALVLSVTYPNCIYYTSDTHCIIVGGHVYGRSNQVSADAPFAYLPADVSSPSADPQFDGNHDTIYIQPIKTGADAGKIKLWWYVNGAWTSTDTLDLVLPTEASDITYDLTNTPDLGSGDVQSAIEALDGNVEELRDDVFGDEWVDEIHGRRFLSLGSEYGWYRNYTTLRNTNVLTGDWNANVIGFKVKAGDKFRLVGMSTNNYSYSTSAPMAAFFDVYEVPNASGSQLSNYTFPNAQYVGGYVPTPLVAIDDIVEIPQGVEMVVFRATKNGVISSGGYLWYAADDKSSCFRYLGNTLSIADKTGYKIDNWTDDEIITSTSLAVGSIMPSWSDGTRYGSRGVRLNVKEGDKVLLDTYSPALFGLIFTDENRVVKALYDDRRFDGVWTAPCDGYCYIQDVLYRECYHYASAHGHLAYMAHDARKRVAKGGDWYNEYAPRLFNEFFPYTDTFTASGATRNVDFPIINNSAALLCYSNKKFQLHMAKLRYADGSPMVADGSYIHLRLNGSDTGSIINDRAYPVDMPDGKSTWVYAIVNTTLNAFASTMLRPYITGLTNGTEYSIIWEKVFVHTSSDFAELYSLAQKIINGEVEVDNFYGVKEKEVDFVKNAIGLQSISDLGYNILEHGATLPIDEEGYKYAKAIYERYKDNPPSTSTQRLFENDQKLVYLPSIDFSVARNGGSFMQFTFQNCYNLICVDDIEMPSNNPTYNDNNLSGTFQNCRCLKRVGNITCPTNRNTNLGSTFSGCYALEYVGKIIAPSSQSMAYAFRYTYSLKRIEELNMKNVNDMSSCFQYCGAEYLLMKNIGMVVSYNPSFSALLQWGINSDENPDARQSLVDSLLTYSYDRVNDPDNLGTADTTCTITLSANSYAQLTASEIEAITAKGYTLTHP